MFRRESVCLVLVDLQMGFLDPFWGTRNNPLLESRVARLLGAFRAAKLPVVHVRHDSREPGSPLRNGASGFDFLPEAQARKDEIIFTKSAHGAFVGTKLEEYLRWRGLNEPIFAGLTADHCVSTSVRMAHDLGFSPLVVLDATAAFPRKSPFGHWLSADTIQEAALASLDGEFARTVNTDYLEFHLRRTE